MHLSAEIESIKSQHYPLRGRKSRIRLGQTWALSADESAARCAVHHVGEE